MILKLLIVLPAYNEEKMIGDVLKGIPKKIPSFRKIEVAVVSDGSSDRTASIARKAGATIIEHNINRGLGAALGTGFQYAKDNNFDALLTFDSDGQHNHNDILPVLRPIAQGKADVSIGTRLRDPKGMPWYRIFGIWGLNILTFIFYWVWTSDSQSGLRAFSKQAIEIINIQSNKMEVSSEFFYEVGKRDLRLAEVPIRSIYTKYSLAKGQRNINGFKILSKLIYRRFFSK